MLISNQMEPYRFHADMKECLDRQSVDSVSFSWNGPKLAPLFRGKTNSHRKTPFPLLSSERVPLWSLDRGHGGLRGAWLAYTERLSLRERSARQDKSAHMLWLGAHFTALLVSTIIRNRMEKMSEREKEKSEVTRGRKRRKKNLGLICFTCCVPSAPH